ncbi:MAG: rRNA maturation RNase YbeY [Gammaproteobacteria bacterium RIFCSPHIGHO2_12_FULL_38_11]|nr:MAG: rRNA maturation RNase YbeY [Gammaproteobacteria bacterium RIFCSPHIGHO2_12_FULL_38_11]
MKLILLNAANHPNIPTKKQFQHWINETIKVIHEKIPVTCNEVCISIIDKETSAHLNETYRQKTGPTNVLSFVYEPTPGIVQASLGDLAICAAIVERESPLETEAHWAHLTVHGLLHLVGYDHIIEVDAKIMETLEIKTLKQLGFKDPYL